MKNKKEIYQEISQTHESIKMYKEGIQIEAFKTKRSI